MCGGADPGQQLPLGPAGGPPFARGAGATLRAARLPESGELLSLPARRQAGDPLEDRRSHRDRAVQCHTPKPAAGCSGSPGGVVGRPAAFAGGGRHRCPCSGTWRSTGQPPRRSRSSRRRLSRNLEAEEVDFIQVYF